MTQVDRLCKLRLGFNEFRAGTMFIIDRVFEPCTSIEDCSNAGADDCPGFNFGSRKFPGITICGYYAKSLVS